MYHATLFAAGPRVRPHPTCSGSLTSLAARTGDKSRTKHGFPLPCPSARDSAAPCWPERMCRWAAQRRRPLLSHPVRAYPDPQPCHGARPQVHARSASPQSSGGVPRLERGLAVRLGFPTPRPHPPRPPPPHSPPARRASASGATGLPHSREPLQDVIGASASGENSQTSAMQALRLCLKESQLLLHLRNIIIGPKIQHSSLVVLRIRFPEP